MSMLGAAPASQPSEPQIRTWFNQLADSDSAVREDAIQNLMGINAADLPTLHKVAQQSLPLAPSQKVVLRDIVMQVYLSGLAYTSVDKPFLGVSWGPPPPAILAFPQEQPPLASDPSVVVLNRVAGFDTYRVLRDGDVILAISVGLSPEEAVNRDDFADAVGRFSVGQSLSMRVMRDGREIVVHVLVRPRPVELNIANPDLDSWQNPRLHIAGDYWTKNFADLVGEELS